MNRENQRTFEGKDKIKSMTIFTLIESSCMSVSVIVGPLPPFLTTVYRQPFVQLEPDGGQIAASSPRGDGPDQTSPVHRLLGHS